MLRPHDGEYAQFRIAWLAPQNIQQMRIFLLVNAMLGHEFRSDFYLGHVGHFDIFSICPLTIRVIPAKAGIHNPCFVVLL